MATEVRPVVRHQPPDWYTQVYTQATNADRQNSASHQVRQESRFLRNETDIQTKWDQYSTDVRLADRVDHLRNRKVTLERLLGQLDQEIADLSEAKETSENTLESMNLRTDIAVECLTLREGRKNVDVVEDGPETQLHKEVEVIDGVKKALQQKISEAFEQLCLLQEARQQIQADLQDKSITLGIDIDQYNLSDWSTNITYKTDPLKVPEGSTTIQQWDGFCRYNKERADAELRSSIRLREQIHNLLHKAANDLEAQKEAAEFAFRKRIHDNENSKDELEWQKKNTEHEIADMLNDIRGVEEALRNNSKSTKKAETRLINRSYRPNVERCRDAAQYGLEDELKQLYATKSALEEKLKQAQHTFDGLQKSLHRLNDDIALRTLSLHLDNRCMDIRLKLNPPAKTNIEHNLSIYGIEKIKPFTLP